MWSKSNSLVVSFLFVASILVGLYAVHFVETPLREMGESVKQAAAGLPAALSQMGATLGLSLSPDFGAGLARLVEALGLSLGSDFDLWTAFAIVLLGFVAYGAGAEVVPLVMMGSLAVFFTLTLHEDFLTKYLTLAAMLFSVGLYGMTTSRNAVRVLMCIELMLNAVNINMVAFARYIDPSDLRGQVFAVFILTVAAAEAAVGLAIVLAIYRTSATVNMEKFNLMKW